MVARGQPLDCPGAFARDFGAPATSSELRPEAFGTLRGGILVGSGIVLLGGPAVLAFATGGYFDRPRLWAGLLAWLIVALAAACSPDPRLGGRSLQLAIGALALLAVWTMVAVSWAPVAGTAYAAAQRLVLYVGVLLGATLLLRQEKLQLAAAPILAAGALIVMGYGLSERMLPGLLHFARSTSAEGRLEQPLTYWNAMGELAAIGLVLAVAVAGDPRRAGWLRRAGAAATAPLGLGLYLTFSRGALFACAAGMISLVVVARERAVLWSLLLGLAAGILAALSAAPFRGVTALTGSLSTREHQGLVTLAAVLAIMVASAVVQGHLTRREPSGWLALPRRAPWLALGLVCAGLALAVVAGAKEGSGGRLAGGATRLTTLQSDRYDYWRVALHEFQREPLRGAGPGGWAVAWLRERPYAVGALDAHSLPLQTAAELGIVGLALLGAFFWGVAAAGRAAVRLARARAAAPLAGCVAYVAHAPLDWDWEMPAVTLLALVLAGLLLAQSAPLSSPQRPGGEPVAL